MDTEDDILDDLRQALAAHGVGPVQVWFSNVYEALMTAGQGQDGMELRDRLLQLALAGDLSALQAEVASALGREPVWDDAEAAATDSDVEEHDLVQRCATVFEATVGELVRPSLVEGLAHARGDKVTAVVNEVVLGLTSQFIHYVRVTLLPPPEQDDDDGALVGLPPDLPGDGTPRVAPMARLMRRGTAGAKRGRPPDVGSRILWLCLDTTVRGLEDSSRPAPRRVKWNYNSSRGFMDVVEAHARFVRDLVLERPEVDVETLVQAVQDREPPKSRDATTVDRQVKRAREAAGGDSPDPG